MWIQYYGNTGGISDNGQEPARIGRAEGVGVRTDGQEDNKSGAWEYRVGCTQKTWDRRALHSGKFGFYFVRSHGCF